MKVDPNDCKCELKQYIVWAVFHDLICHPLLPLTCYSPWAKWLHNYTSNKAWPRKKKMSKKTYTLTDEQFNKILAASQPVPMIMLQCGEPRSAQENANAAWNDLGKEMGFDGATVVMGSHRKEIIAEEV